MLRRHPLTGDSLKPSAKCQETRDKRQETRDKKQGSSVDHQQTLSKGN